MKKLNVCIPLFVASLLVGAPHNILARECGTSEPTQAERTILDNIVTQYRSAQNGVQNFTAQQTIPVKFHIVRTSSTGWNVSDSVLDDQINILNVAFQSMNVDFFIQSTMRYIKPQWASVPSGGPAEEAMKQELHTSPERIINVYVVEHAGLSGGGNILGYAYLPGLNPANDSKNGVVVLRTTLPGNGDSAGLGQTLTHEIGHHLGLYHTFQGGCSSNNDACADTPAHQANYGRPSVNTDTCPGLPGSDPVHNYMNYVDDIWMTEFTPDQGTRTVAITGSLLPDLLKNYLWEAFPRDAANWRNATWYEWINDQYFPWIYSSVHGWQMSQSEVSSNVWIYDSEMGWLYTTDSNYPWMYSSERQCWLFFDRNSGGNGGANRWFYDDCLDIWFQVGGSQRTN